MTVLLAFREAGREGSRNAIQGSVYLNKNVKKSVPFVMRDRWLDLVFGGIITISRLGVYITMIQFKFESEPHL